MHPKLQQVYTRLENQRNVLLDKVKALSPEKLAARPAPGKWSVLEILTHVYTSEKLSIAYIKKKSLGIEAAGNAGLWQKILVVALKISQRVPLRYKAPKVVMQHTPENLLLQQLLAEWDLLRIELKSILENVPEKHVNKLVYKHPFAGRLSLPQAVQFFGEHMHHHTPQILRILKKFNPAKAV